MNKFNLLLAFLVAATFSSCITTSMLEKNALGQWKPTDFAGHGDVTVKNGVLKIGMGIELSGVNWTGEIPKGEYEISLESRRVQGNDFFCGLTFPVKGSHATLILGGWGGALVGISSLDNLDAAENETGDVYVFEDGKWYGVTLRVQKNRIRVWINEKEQIDVDLTDRKVGMRIGEIEQSVPLGIATWMTGSEIRKIKIRDFIEEAK
ncbi:MAG: DUF1080 domain-containing protein [Opitutae bacterium]|nr:DUF1080 domain-containing protein [Opitutae bacterium]